MFQSKKLNSWLISW